MKKKTQFINNRGEVVELDDGDVIPDGWGVRVSSFLMDGVPVTDAESEIRDAHAAMVKRAEDGWRGGNTRTVRAIQDSSADAREAYIARMSNAWRGGQAEYAVLPPAPRHWARPAPDAWGGAWKNESAAANPNPKPADIAMDSANSDAAHAALVRRTENAWKTGGAPR